MAIWRQPARITRLTITAAVAAASAALAVVPVVTASAATQPQRPARIAQAGASAADQQAAANKALVLYFYDQLFNHGNLSVIDKYIGSTYIQHNPTVANGAAALRQLVVSTRKQFPNGHNYVERALAEGDLVLLQSHVVSVPGTTGLAIDDIFRVVGGKIVEHWDTIESVPATTASGNDLFAQLSSPKNTSAPPAVMALDEGIVMNYFTDVMQVHDLSAIGRYVSGSLYQHDPALRNGAAALKQYYTALYQQHPEFNASVAQVVADGDLVAVHSHYRDSPSDLGQSVYDIFRVVGGKIVEHWDVVQAVPPTSANNNTMF